MFAFVVFDLAFQYLVKKLAGKNVSEMTYPIWPHRLARTAETACKPAVECYRRRQTPATVTSLAPLHYV